VQESLKSEPLGSQNEDAVVHDGTSGFAPPGRVAFYGYVYKILYSSREDFCPLKQPTIYMRYIRYTFFVAQEFEVDLSEVRSVPTKALIGLYAVSTCSPLIASGQWWFRQIWPLVHLLDEKASVDGENEGREVG
jgi:hypothetical protein